MWALLQSPYLMDFRVDLMDEMAQPYVFQPVRLKFAVPPISPQAKGFMRHAAAVWVDNEISKHGFAGQVCVDDIFELSFASTSPEGLEQDFLMTGPVAALRSIDTRDHRVVR